MARNPLFVLYVGDQERATSFYHAVLDTTPRLNVPGMTEIDLPGGAALGLMPVSGIRRLLPNLPEDDGRRISRCELYMAVDDPAAYHGRVLANGGQELSALAPRDWGDEVAYSMDLDGHVLAFCR